MNYDFCLLLELYLIRQDLNFFLSALMNWKINGDGEAFTHLQGCFVAGGEPSLCAAVPATEG